MPEETRTINIDKRNIFVNPFQKFDSEKCSMELFERYLSCKANHKILKAIGDDEIISSEHEESGVTRSEVFRRLACKFGYRTKPTTVHRNILSNMEGIIVNQVNCSGKEIGDSFSNELCAMYPIVKETYDKLQVKSPGSIQLFKIHNESNLWVCNMFTKKNTSSITQWVFNLFGKATAVKNSDIDHFKSALAKLRVQIKKNHIQNIPVYVPNEMGKYQGWNWEQNLSLVMKMFPDAVICIK